MMNDGSLHEYKTNSYTSQEENPNKRYTSTIATIFNLINSLLGAGILGVPNAFTHCGFVPSLLLVTAVAATSYASACIVVKLQFETNAGSISDLAKMTMGRTGTVLLSICVVLFCYSSMTAYLIIGSDVIMFFLKKINIEVEGRGQRAALVLIFSLCLPIAMTFPRQIAVLSAISTFAFFGLIMFVVAMIIEGCTNLPKHGIAPTAMTGTFNIHFFNALSIMSLCFALASIILPVIMESHPNIEHRLKEVSWASYLSFLIVAIPAVLGYLMFGEETQEVIFDSFPENDIIMIIVRVAYFVILTASYPVLGMSVLTTFSVAIFGVHDQKSLPWSKRWVILLCENVLTLFVAMFFPNVRPVMAIGGAIGGCMTNFFFPPVFYLIIKKVQWTNWKHILLIILAIFGIVSTVISTYEAITDAIRAFSKKN